VNLQARKGQRVYHPNAGLEVGVVEVGNRMLFAIDLNLGVGILALGFEVGVGVYMIG
jgi:hypothetical protein